MRTLFLVDRLGRLLHVNDLGQPPAPRVFVGSGLDGSRVVRVGAELPERDRLALLRCAHDDAALRAAVGRIGPIVREQRGPAFVLPAGIAPAGGAVEVADAFELHPDLAPWGPELQARHPCFGVVEDGVVVSICCCARSTPEAAEAGVETAEAYRGRGFAVAAVAAWGAAVCASGRVAFYSTSAENRASQAVARRLDARLFGEDWSLW